jgi:hypothetical protein
VACLGASEDVCDLVQEGVENRFLRAVQGVILSNLDAFLPVLTHSQLTFRLRKTEGPTLQAVLRHFPAGDSFQFLQVHESLSVAMN